MTGKVKAYSCYNGARGDTSWGFFISRGRAKVALMHDLDMDGDHGFTEVRVYREPKLDHLGKPDGYIMDWLDPEDRTTLVRELGVYCGDGCFDPDGECPGCPAEEYCDYYHDWVEEEMQ